MSHILVQARARISIGKQARPQYPLPSAGPGLESCEAILQYLLANRRSRAKNRPGGGNEGTPSPSQVSMRVRAGDRPE